MRKLIIFLLLIIGLYNLSILNQVVAQVPTPTPTPVICFIFDSVKGYRCSFGGCGGNRCSATQRYVTVSATGTACCARSSSGCENFVSCVAPTATSTPAPPMATSVPPTATPVLRPALCQSATISSSTLSKGSLTITSTANSSDIKTFSYAFYNSDNLYGPNNPKPIFFAANTHYIRSDNTTPPVNPPSHSIPVTYDELNRPDLNWGNGTQKPTKIQVNAYFTNSQGRLSAPDSKCVVMFDITVPTTSTTPIPGCTKKSQGDANCDGNVNGADYSFWLNRQCTTGCSATNLVADFNGDNKVDDNDYAIWFNNRQ